MPLRYEILCNPRRTIQPFFYRVHLSWNNLPLSLREIIRPSVFKKKLLDHLWKSSIKDEYDRCVEGISDDPLNFLSGPGYYDEHMMTS